MLGSPVLSISIKLPLWKSSPTPPIYLFCNFDEVSIECLHYGDCKHGSQLNHNANYDCFFFPDSGSPGVYNYLVLSLIFVCLVFCVLIMNSTSNSSPCV